MLLSGLRVDNLFDGLVGGNCNGLSGGGWTNNVTGTGNFYRDKVLQASFQEAYRIDDPQLSALFNGNDIAQRIIMAKPKEMFRRGWVLSFPGTGPAQAGGKDKAKPPGEDPGKKIGEAQPKGLPAKGGQGSAVAAPGTTGRADAGDDFTRTADRKAGVKKAPQEAQTWLGTNDGPQGGTGQVDRAPEPQEKDPPASQGGDTGDYELSAAQTAGQGESGPAAPSAEAVAVPGVVQKPGGGDYDAQDQNGGADIAKQIELYADNLQLKARCLESTIFGRLYGGGLLIVGADDGQNVIEPLDEKNIKSIKYLTWIDRRFIVAHTYYEMIGPKYGEVQVYNVINPFGNQTNTLIHESRVIRFDGAPVDLLMRRRLAGWTLSMLQAPYDTMRQFDQSFQSIANLMTDLSQAVMKINGLAQMISNDQKTLQTRMTMVDMSRSSGRMVYLDAQNEEFERSPTPLTGVADTIEMQMLRMAAAAEMPVAILFGREPSGLNATGDADFRRFYDMIAGDQKDILEPKLKRLYKLICLAKDAPTKGTIPDGGYEFTWHKLYAPSELEQSTIRWNMAQADDKYIANGTLTEDEVAMSRFRSGELHLDTEIDGSLRRDRMATAELPPNKAEQAKTDQANAEKQSQDQFGLTAMKVGAKPPKGPPGKPGAAKPPAGRADSDTIKSILKGLKDDYPEDVIEWVKAAQWEGPRSVRLKRIDFSGRKHWRATTDDLSGYIEDIKKGHKKPIMLVKTPDNDKYEVVDGHHRLLSYEALGMSPIAYVATVDHEEGPWDTMHEAQNSGSSKTAGGSVPPGRGSVPPAA